MTPAIEKVIARLQQEDSRDPWAQAGVYVALDAAVEASIGEAKAPTLASAIAWGEDGKRLASKAHALTSALAELGCAIVERCEAACGEGTPNERLGQVTLIALANAGSAARWAVMLQGAQARPDYSTMHALYRRAEKLGLARSIATFTRNARPVALTAEAHYLRALLMPVFCHESLDPQQLEIVDALLWTWAADYRLTRQVEGSEPRLWVDLRGRHGVSVRQFMPEGEDVRHLVVARLGEQVRALIARFHAGHMAAGGCASGFPIEAHIGVLDQVQMLWDQIQNGAPKRRYERQPRADSAPVQALVGLGEIFSAEDPLEKPAYRTMRVRDESLGGAGLVSDTDLWGRIWHGDLVGLRETPGTLPRIGVVVRKFASDGGDPAIGVEWIACTCRKISIHVVGGENHGRVVPALYVVGDEDSGRLDTIVVEEKRFMQDTRFEVPLGERVFEVRLNRLLRRGRGWVAAGYEIVGVRKAELIS